jgi:hypothetical protein
VKPRAARPTEPRDSYASGIRILTRHLPHRATHIWSSCSASRQASSSAQNEGKTWYYTQKYLHVQALTATMNKHRHSRCHYKRNYGSTPAGTNNPRVGGPAGRQNPWWLADARSGSSDNDLRSEWPNSSSDDLRADAAATSSSPTPPLEGRGQAEGRRVRGQSAGGADYPVGRETSSGCRGGRWHRKKRRSRSGWGAEHAAVASATNGERPSPRSLREGAGRCPRGDRPQLGALLCLSPDDENP